MTLEHMLSVLKTVAREKMILYSLRKRGAMAPLATSLILPKVSLLLVKRVNLEIYTQGIQGQS